MQKKDDATSGNKLLRLFQFLMANSGRHYQTELSARLNCSPQTVIRLMREIEAVVGSSLELGREGHRRWYRFKPKQYNRLGLHLAELDFLSVFSDLASPFLTEEERRRIDSSLFNFSMILADPSYLGDMTTASKGSFVFTSRGCIDYSSHFEILDQLARALRENFVCRINYRLVGGTEVKEHIFAPSRFVSMSGAIYILGAILSKDCSNLRRLTSLAVHRILDIEVTDKHSPFEITERDLSMFGMPWHEPRNFCIRFAPGPASDYVRERVWSDQQRLFEMDDGGVILEIVSRSEPEVISWVRSFGKDAVLLNKDKMEAREVIPNYAQPGATHYFEDIGIDMPDLADAGEPELGTAEGRFTALDKDGKDAWSRAPANSGDSGQNGAENADAGGAAYADQDAAEDAVQAAVQPADQPKRRLLRPAMRRRGMPRRKV